MACSLRNTTQIKATPPTTDSSTISTVRPVFLADVAPETWGAAEASADSVTKAKTVDPFLTIIVLDAVLESLAASSVVGLGGGVVAAADVVEVSDVVELVELAELLDEVELDSEEAVKLTELEELLDSALLLLLLLLLIELLELDDDDETIEELEAGKLADEALAAAAAPAVSA